MTAFPNLPLSTARLSLRLLRANDVPDLLAIYGNAEVVRYWSHLPWTGRQQAEAMLTRDHAAFAEGSALRLGIELASEQRIIGTLALFNLSTANRRGEIGYALARDRWACGYMQEALTGFIAWLFGTLDLHRLEADIDPANLASARSLLRMGFQREGLMRERWIVDGQASDTELYGLLAREWRRAGIA